MKIGFVNDTFLQGRGADSVIYELAKQLGRKHQVHVIASESNFKEKNFKFIKLKASKLMVGKSEDFKLFSNIKKFKNEMYRLIKKYDYDIINIHHATLALAFKDIRKKFPQTKLIVSFHGYPKIYLSEEGLIRFLGRKFVKFIGIKSLRYTDKIISISNYMKKELISYGLDKKKIKIIYDGVSEEFKPSWQDKNYMLFVGRHEKHKRIDELIKLSKELNFSLKIVGDGPLTKKLKKYARKIKTNKINFVGRVSREGLIKMYQECSFFVSASRWEGFGLIFLEAAACGKPSVAYNICSISEIVKNKETSFLVKNYDEFKARTKVLIKDKRLRKKLGKNALSFSKKFSWNKKAKEYEKIFKR